MDPVSQGVVGAVLAQCVAPRDQRPAVTLVAALAAMSADLDVLIRSAQDPLLHLEYHRHFTHSLLFIPFGGTLAALLLWPLLRRWIRWRAAWGAAIAGYATAGLLDACTSYGTHLLWPFSDHRTAWSCISIVDPLFTLPLLALVLSGLRRRRTALPRVALGLALLYLGLGVMQRERASGALEEWARDHGLEPTAVVVKPTMGNLVLWRGMVRSGERWQLAAVRVGIETRITPGDAAVALDGPLPDVPEDSQVARDLERFRAFSSGAICTMPRNPQRITDLRYGRVPHRLSPLWAIDYDPEHPDRHVRFETFRRLSDVELDEFVELLIGTSELRQEAPRREGK